MKSYHSISSLLLLAICFLALPAHSQIWEENFNSYPDGTFNAPPKWTSIPTDCDDAGPNEPGESMWGVYSGQFTVNDIEGAPCCPAFGGGGNDNSWLSEIIDLTGFCDISISLEVFAIGTFECNDPGAPIFGCTGATPPDNSHDQVVVEYSLDGGGFTQFGYVCGINGIGPMNVAGLNGSTLQIRFFAACKSNGETYTIDNIVVNGSPGDTPTFSAIGPLCETDPPVNLPLVSLENITGTWDIGPTFDPTGLGNTTTTITFTPDPSFCAVSSTLDIVVDAVMTPSPTPIGPFCETDPAFPLEVNINGITGNWSGNGVVNNEFDPALAGGGNSSIFFTPDPMQCADDVGLLVMVNVPNDPILGTLSICDNDPLYDLTQLEDPLYTGGTWNGQGVSGNIFDPTGLFGTITLTYVPATICTNIATTSIIVDMAAMPVLLAANVCETSGLFDLVTIQDPSFPLGTWSGPGVTGTSFNPSGLPGDNVLTFTSSQTCVVPSTTTITVDVPAEPFLGSATICETEGQIDLTTFEDPLYTGGTWIGPGVMGTMFDPAGLNGQINLTYTPIQTCVETATTFVIVMPPGTPDLGAPTICESSGLFDLTTIIDPLYPDGVWSGPNVLGNTFDPSGLNGPVGVVFTPTTSCAFEATTLITVQMSGTPDLGDATLCQNSGLFDLTTIQDPDFPDGTWSGDGVSGTDFDPDGLSGNIPLTFDIMGTCVSAGLTSILVNVPGTPVLGTDTLCETEGLFSLSNLADPNYPAGTWTGDGVTGNNFNPSGLSGDVPLVFTPTSNCALLGNTSITVNEPTQPQVGAASTCQNDGPLDLTLIVDPNFPTGTWSGPGVTGNNFNPANQMGTVSIFFTSSAECTVPDTTTINVFLAPTFSNLDEDCDAVTQTYTVSFNIAGGSFAPYTVDGITVPGNTFTSAPIPSGTNYSFELNDSFGCGPVTISGSADCNCATDAGGMDFTNTPILLCDGTDIEVEHLGDEFLDLDDSLIFVLHTNQGTQLGTILSTSTTTTIPFPVGGLTLGQTYFVSAVAGNGDGSGGVDYTDLCLSVSQGVPVSFYLPTISMNQADTICPEDCFVFTGQLTGTAPYIIDYGVFGGGIMIQDTEFGVGNTFTFNICPSAFNLSGTTISLEVYGIIDDNDCYNPTPSNSTTSLFISEISEADFTADYCPGESIVINGTLYDEGNPIGIEIFPNGSANGCDSTVNIDLTYYPPAVEMVEQTLCPGGSVTVNGTIYNQANPDGTEVIPNSSINGCDSTILVDLTFNNTVFENLSPKLCPGGSVVVNGTLYNASNPSGSETFPNGSVLGCDSTVIINLSFYAPASANIQPELCPGGSITVNGTVYDETNPSGTEILPGASVNGCDSMINVAVLFTTEVTFNFTLTLCPNESVTINGEVYDINNPSGSVTFPNGSVLGCDSIVNISLAFYQPATSLIDDEFCTGGSVLVNGVIYDETNPNGTEVVDNGSVNGCDSTIVVDLSFSNEVFETVDPTLCPGESIMVNGLVFDENNSSGTTTLPGGSYLGCDSTVIVDLSFFNENIIDLIETLCAGESLLINGTVYDESNPDGTEVLLNASVNGCDSTVEVALDFHLPIQANFEQQLCTGGSITINGTVYDETNPGGIEILQNASVNGCDSTVFVNIEFTDEVQFELVDILCPGEVLVVNGTTYSEFNLTGSETIPNGSVFGCDSTILVEISYYPEAVSIVEDTLTFGTSITINGTVYNHSNPSGTEVIIGGSVNGCDSTIFISLVFAGAIEVSYEANSTSCELGDDGSIIIESIIGGTPPYVIALNGANSAAVAVFPYFFEDLENGFYSLTVVDADGLVHTEEIFLPFPTPPLFDLGDDIFIDLGESFTLAAETDFTPASYFWEPDTYLDCTDCDMPFARPADDITYLLTVTDSNGCIFTDDINVFVQKARNVYGPTAFSPNNDARNDEFTLFTGGQVAQINSLLIFDRWGALMFEQYNFEPNNLSIGWDGRQNGKMMNPGVYVWFAEVAFLDGHVGVYEGEVILIR